MMNDKSNSKMKEDIKKNLDSQKAKLAITILNKVEQKNDLHSEIKNLASKIYNGADEK